MGLTSRGSREAWPLRRPFSFRGGGACVRNINIQLNTMVLDYLDLYPTPPFFASISAHYFQIYKYTGHISGVSAFICLLKSGFTHQKPAFHVADWIPRFGLPAEKKTLTTCVCVLKKQKEANTKLYPGAKKTRLMKR